MQGEDVGLRDDGGGSARVADAELAGTGLGQLEEVAGVAQGTDGKDLQVDLAVGVLLQPLRQEVGEDVFQLAVVLLVSQLPVVGLHAVAFAALLVGVAAGGEGQRHDHGQRQGQQSAHFLFHGVLLSHFAVLNL